MAGRLLTAYEVCEMKRELEGENANGNRRLGRYVQVYKRNEEEFSCVIEKGRPENNTKQFLIRAVQWEGKNGLRKAFVDAGYESVRLHHAV